MTLTTHKEANTQGAAPTHAGFARAGDIRGQAQDERGAAAGDGVKRRPDELTGGMAPSTGSAASEAATVGAIHRTRIKICGLTREEDVDAAVAAGADAIGFVLYAPSPRYVHAERAAELARRLPPFVTPVLLFVNASATEIIAACAGIPGALLQFHGDETPQACLKPKRPFLRAARIPLDEKAAADDERFDLVKYAEDFKAAHAILLDAHVEGFGGGGKTFNWSLLPPSVNAHLVLSGGLTPANVIDGILQVRPRCLSLAVDVSSGVEVSTATGATLKGIKSADKINQFVAAVRAADEHLAKNFHRHVQRHSSLPPA